MAKKLGDRTLAYMARTFHIDQIFNVPNYILNPHKDIGAYGYANIFDILCSVIEKTFSMQDIRNVYIMRHCVNYTFYFSGCIFFLSLYKRFSENNFLWLHWICILPTQSKIISTWILQWKGFYSSSSCSSIVILSSSIL